MMAKPMKTLELHYPMIQFLIISFMYTVHKCLEHIPTHERIAVRNICMRSSSHLGEICSLKRHLTSFSNKFKLNFTTVLIENADTRLAYITFIKGQ